MFSRSSFTFIKWLFSSYSISAIRVVTSAYLRLLIFLPAILIPACASSIVKLINMLPHIFTIVCMVPGVGVYVSFHFSENNFLKKEVTFNFN